MKKTTTSFVCQECGYDTAQWMGKCPECGAWNSLKEFKESRSRNKESGSSTTHKENKPKSLSEITSNEKSRMSTGFAEMDSVLGGGIVLGSVILVAGDPGIGKSTLLLQLALNLSKVNDRAEVANENFRVAHAKKQTSKIPVVNPANSHSENFVGSPRNSSVLYVSAEESEQQVKMRADRLSSKATNLLLLSTTDTDAICLQIETLKPSLVIVDSIQTIASENIDALSGAVSQVRYATSQLVKVAKSNNIPVIIVGHVTKEGMVAGPMVLSHMVDTVLFLEGEKTTQTRILRSLKNRFGPVDEVGIFLMSEKGMEEINNAEQIFLTNKTTGAPGSVTTVTLEGTRTFLIEIQALVISSKLPFPRRVVSGVDSRRLELLLAVLQKHCRLPLDTSDVFVNVAGGIKVTDPGVDAAICLAIYSSFKNIGFEKTVGIAEVGLLGELRKVSMLEKRIKEAKKLGFTNIVSAEKYKSIREALVQFESGIRN